ncbi:hypothetical protein OCL06_03865 [Alteromonas sp. ASW11-19]|uniref:Uncharacterized protein n=1 Tax=Alteromonas salexigens TaxID=2982530 RepID=A0ABT2VLK5_9ALTE|nr:hypothetical protein [Alteromonas salexigens]MCU7553733.1 hypothetical protein [Alteromonas salexigens]
MFVPVTPRPQSSQPDRTATARQNVTPPPLVAMVDFKDVAPNSEPLIGATDSDVTPEPAAQSIEVSEPARLARFGCAGIYLFVLRRALTARGRKASA